MFSVYSYFYSLTPRYLIKVIGTDLGWLMMFGWCWRSDQYELYQVYQVSDTKTDEGTLQLDIKHLFPNI